MEMKSGPRMFPFPSSTYMIDPYIISGLIFEIGFQIIQETICGIVFKVFGTVLVCSVCLFGFLYYRVPVFGFWDSWIHIVLGLWFCVPLGRFGCLGFRSGMFFGSGVFMLWGSLDFRVLDFGVSGF